MTAEQKLVLRALAEEAALAVTYAERGEVDQSLVHMRRVSEALSSIVKDTTRSPFARIRDLTERLALVDAAGPRLAAYLALERKMLLLDQLGDPIADKLRDAMDLVWLELTDAERDLLNAHDPKPLRPRS